MRFLFLLTLGLFLAAPLYSQQDTSLPVDLPSMSELEERLESVESDSELADDEKSKAIELLKLAITRIKSAAKQKRQAEDYAEELRTAPLQKMSFESRAAALQETDLASDLADSSLVDVEEALKKQQSELAGLKKRHAELEEDIAKEKAFDTRAALAEARREQAKISTPLAEAADSGQNPEAMLTAATRYLQQMRIEKLEQRQLSFDARIAALEAEQAFVAKQIAMAAARMAQLSSLVSSHRQSEAQRTLQKTRQTLKDLSAQSPAIIALAEDNVMRADELRVLVGQQDAVRRDTANKSQLAHSLEQKYQSLNEQLEISQLDSSAEFGAALRKQRDQLTDVESARDQLREQEKALTRARLAQFQIESLREQDNDSQLVDIAAQLDTDAANSFTEEEQQTLRQLLADRGDILDKLSMAYSRYIDDLGQLNAQSRLVISQSQQYANLLDQHLLWMPSARAMGVATITGLGTSLAWATAVENWQEVGATLIDHVERNKLATLFALLILIYLLRRRRGFVAMLAGMQDKVGKVNRDRMSYTVAALVLTLLLALPGPLTMVAVAALLHDPGTFSGALNSALMVGATFYFIMEFVLQSVRRNGLAELHFNWSPVLIKAIKRHLPWFKIIFIPAVVLNLVIELDGSAEIRDSLGRIAFIAITIVMATFAYRILYPQQSMFRRADAQIAGAELWRYRHIAFVLLVVLPWVSAGLSIYGYNYTAVKLDGYLLNSVLVALLGVIVYQLLQRGFSISERRLALERIRAKRAAALVQSENRGAAEATGEGVPTAVDLQEIDLQTVSTHTTALLKMTVAVVVSIMLWNIWQEFFLAFKPLEDVKLYDFVEMVEGAPIGAAVTLWDVLLAAAIAVITFLAAKNIPGLLEIAWLSRISLEVGTSYAITTISRYVIVITGSIVTLQLLGAQWSKLQWLVAALSVGLGFGLQEIVANFVSGIVILFERPIRIGDTVTVGEQSGTVSRIRIRATTIMDWDRREIIIPNKTFITERLVNWTLTDPITRLTVKVGVAYGSDIELAENLLLEAAMANSKVLRDPPPAALFLNFGGSSLDFELRVFVRGVGDLLAVKHGLHVAIDTLFRANNVEIAFPQQDVHFDPKPIEVRLLEAADDAPPAEKERQQ